MHSINFQWGPSLVVQYLRLCSPSAGGPSLIPWQGTGAHVLPLRVHMPQLKIPCAATKTQCSQINKCLKMNKWWVNDSLTAINPLPFIQKKKKFQDPYDVKHYAGYN